MEPYNIDTPIRKKWGQNFLIDKNVINKIVGIINPSKNNLILEIGPGNGAMTIPLSKKVKKIHAVEVDPLLYKKLNKLKIKNLTLFNDDILKWDNKNMNYEIIFGNVPYNISSQIIFKFLSKYDWESMILMLQKELAQRIVSNHNKREFGRISVMVQTFCNAKIETNISKNVFFPKPKVDSSIIRFSKKNKIDLNHDEYSSFIKECFKQKRKKLKNNLRNICDKNILGDLKEKRPENISVSKYIKLYKKIYI